MGQTVNLVAYAFAGSNPAAPTLTAVGPKLRLVCCEEDCGRSSMVELQPSKLVAWVRFPSPALLGRSSAAVAQSVECVLGKDEVMGSNPISSFGLCVGVVRCLV